ncbi:peptidoglycan/LPS O-acetylase OafA/YrhL [Chitinivorax tropicus]|uniref:Peptidoglycan/LPS O-acetylase OafA/YrhL n=1 Tax=Chitinivorax tropicus TaxID=714531 RepID=A0A840MJM8_9PROT|nr:acyltransferase [Chitinivorax tropicus]MBB5017027.1 peptidoglycan/LPS O-acetylase OafA/YrhL [Chitinivorax tropicus]
MTNLQHLADGKTEHVGYLDGWRGLAICALLVGHFFPVPGLNFGTIGVNLFFVLSGLLMGGLLFEKQEPIARFYRRRIARIVPAHLSFILIITLCWFVFDQPISIREFAAAILFLNNYIHPDASTGTGLMPFGHIWSLSVEEHSYIVLSLIAVICRRHLFSQGRGVAVLFAASVACTLVYQWWAPPKLAFTQWLQTETAAYGLLGAALWVAAGRPMPTGLTWRWAAPALLLAGIVLHWWSWPLAVQRILGTGCFIASICMLTVTRGWFAAMLSWVPLRQLGLWSYSLYLWQQPFYLWSHQPHGPSPVLALLLGLVCGLASYYLVERPTRAYLNAHWGAHQAATKLALDRRT